MGEGPLGCSAIGHVGVPGSEETGVAEDSEDPWLCGPGCFRRAEPDNKRPAYFSPFADQVCFPEGTSGTHRVPILGKGQRAAFASDAAGTLRLIARRRVRGRLGERNLLVYCYLRHRHFELIAWADDKPDLLVVVDLPTVYKIVKHSLRPPSERVRTTSFST